MGTFLQSDKLLNLYSSKNLFFRVKFKDDKEQYMWYAEKLKVGES